MARKAGTTHDRVEEGLVGSFKEADGQHHVQLARQVAKVAQQGVLSHLGWPNKRNAGMKWRIVNVKYGTIPWLRTRNRHCFNITETLLDHMTPTVMQRRAVGQGSRHRATGKTSTRAIAEPSAQQKAIEVGTSKRAELKRMKQTYIGRPCQIEQELVLLATEIKILEQLLKQNDVCSALGGLRAGRTRKRIAGQLGTTKGKVQIPRVQDARRS